MNVFQIDHQVCTECMECLMHCPSNALRMEQGEIQVNPQRCVSCGSCFRRCGHGAVVRSSQVEQVKDFIKMGRKELTQKEVAQEMGISQSYISRLEKRILLRLRKEFLRQTSCA